jgi:hypothetical protein
MGRDPPSGFSWVPGFLPIPRCFFMSQLGNFKGGFDVFKVKKEELKH